MNAYLQTRRNAPCYERMWSGERGSEAWRSLKGQGSLPWEVMIKLESKRIRSYLSYSWGKAFQKMEEYVQKVQMFWNERNNIPSRQQNRGSLIGATEWEEGRHQVRLGKGKGWVQNQWRTLGWRLTYQICSENIILAVVWKMDWESSKCG